MLLLVLSEIAHIDCPNTNCRSDAGISYIIYGKAGGSGDIDLASLTAAQGFKVFGAVASQSSGVSVSAGRDVTGDGLPDILVGASGSYSGNPTSLKGSAYVVYGKGITMNSNVDLALYV